MTKANVPVSKKHPVDRREPNRRYANAVPKEHRASLDTRIQWMWNQRLGVIQMIWQTQKRPNGDVLDLTAATLFLQAIHGEDLTSIAQIFNRLEGGALDDTEELEREVVMRI